MATYKQTIDGLFVERKALTRNNLKLFMVSDGISFQSIVSQRNCKCIRFSLLFFIMKEKVQQM